MAKAFNENGYRFQSTQGGWIVNRGGDLGFEYLGSVKRSGGWWAPYKSDRIPAQALAILDRKFPPKKSEIKIGGEPFTIRRDSSGLIILSNASGSLQPTGRNVEEAKRLAMSLVRDLKSKRRESAKYEKAFDRAAGRFADSLGKFDRSRYTGDLVNAEKAFRKMREAAGKAETKLDYADVRGMLHQLRDHERQLNIRRPVFGVSVITDNPGHLTPEAKAHFKGANMARKKTKSKASRAASRVDRERAAALRKLRAEEKAKARELEKMTECVRRVAARCTRLGCSSGDMKRAALRGLP